MTAILRGRRSRWFFSFEKSLSVRAMREKQKKQSIMKFYRNSFDGSRWMEVENSFCRKLKISLGLFTLIDGGERLSPKQGTQSDIGLQPRDTQKKFQYEKPDWAYGEWINYTLWIMRYKWLLLDPINRLICVEWKHFPFGEGIADQYSVNPAGHFAAMEANKNKVIRFTIGDHISFLLLSLNTLREK